MLLLCVGVSLATAQAQETQNKHQVQVYNGPRTPVTGDLTTERWKQAPVYQLHNYRANQPVNAPTELRLLQDANGLYIGITCMEPLMSKVKAEKTVRDSKLSSDDCVEIFIDPSRTKDRYCQFLVNSLGTMEDWETLEGGNAAAPGRRSWQAAARRLDDRWTVELFIPWATLGSWQPGRPDAGFNVTRERYATGEQELYTWADVKKFHDPQNFNVLTGLLVDTQLFANQIANVQGDVSPTDDGQWRVDLIAEWTCEGKVQPPLTFEFVNEQTGEIMTSVEMKNLSDHDGAAAVKLPPFSRENLEPLVGVLQIRQGDGRMVACRRSIVELEYEPVKIELTQPGYRNTIYASQDIQAIVGRVSVARSLLKDGNRIVVDLRDQQNQSVAQQEVVAHDGMAVFTLPAVELPVGQYQLIARLEDAYGEELVTRQVDVRKVGPPVEGSNEVRVDAQGRVLLNGEPFAPVGWFGAEWIGVVRHGYDWFDSSVNFFHNNREQQNDEIYRAGKYFALQTPKDYKEWTVRDDLSDATKQKVREYVEKYRSHPGLIAWYLADEPEINDVRPKYLENYYRYIAELDPYHVCWVIHNSVNGRRDYEAACDVTGIDPYFLPQRDGSLEVLRRFTPQQQGAAQPKPVWATLMAYGAYDFNFQMPGITPDTRAPNYLESRAMHLYAVMRGVQGFSDFQTQYAICDPELRVGIPAIQRELNWLEPYIMADAQARLHVSTSTPQVEAAARQTAGRRIVIAVNTQNKPCDATIKLDSKLKGSWGVLSEGRVVSVTNGEIRDTFAPLEVHIYCDREEDAEALQTVAQVARTIEEYRQSLRAPGNIAQIDNLVEVRASNKQYSVLPGLFDGITDGLGWWALAKRPAWLELTFKDFETVGRVVLFTPDIRKFEVQGYDGEEWKSLATVEVDLPSSAGFVRLPVRAEVEFTPQQLLKLRIMISDNAGGEINELWVSDGQVMNQKSE